MSSGSAATRRSGARINTSDRNAMAGLSRRAEQSRKSNQAPHSTGTFPPGAAALFTSALVSLVEEALDLLRMRGRGSNAHCMRCAKRARGGAGLLRANRGCEDSGIVPKNGDVLGSVRG